MTKLSARDMEQLFAERLAYTNLNAESLARYEDCRTSHRFMAHPDTRLMVYSMVGSGRAIVPKIHQVLTCVSVDCDNLKGFSAKWLKGDGSTFSVGYSPIEIDDSCFVYMPRILSLEYSEYKPAKFNSRFSMCYRTAHHPDWVHEGVKYMLEESVFNERFAGSR